MSGIIHIECPRCRGTLGLEELDRIVRCSYCGAMALVDGPVISPRYVIPAALDKDQARRALQRMLADPRLQEGLLQSSRLHSAELCFVPFYEVTARRLGTLRLRAHTTTRRLSLEDAWVRDSFASGTLQDELGSCETVQNAADTRVVIGDVTRLEPAVSLPRWELGGADIARLRADPAGGLQPFDHAALSAKGRVLAPTRPIEELLDGVRGSAQASGFADHTELVEVRSKLIYYPLWRLRYRFAGRLYAATLDGVTGRVMAARAPQSDRGRVLWMLWTTIAVAFLVGRLLRSFAILASEVSFVSLLAILVQNAALLVPLLIVVGAFLLIVLAVGWEQFRYPGEVAVRGDSFEVVKLGRPEKTLVDRILGARLWSRLSKALERAGQRQR